MTNELPRCTAKIHHSTWIKQTTTDSWYCTECGLVVFTPPKPKKTKRSPTDPVQLHRGKGPQRAYRQSPTSEKSLAHLETLLRAQKGKCYYCQHPLEASHAVREHKVPYSRGGRAGANIVAACVTCDHEKGNHTPEEWTDRWYENDTLALETRREDKSSPYTYDPYSKDTSWNWENKKRDQQFHE